MRESNLTAFPETEEWLQDNCANAELDVPAFQRRPSRCELSSCRGMAIGGNDVNSGTLLLPWVTLQHAWDFIENSLDLGEWTITIHVGPGTYQPFIASGAIPGASATSVTFVGDITTPSNCVISATAASAVFVIAGAALTLQGFRVSATGSAALTQGYGIIAGAGGIVAINFIEFGACTSACCTSLGGFLFSRNSSLSIVANSPIFLEAGGNGSNIAFNSVTVTLMATPHFTTFAVVFDIALISLVTVTWVGAAGSPGTQYSIVGNSVIDTGGISTNWPTGLGAGGTATGGKIV